jgi:hypothetical protein
VAWDAREAPRAPSRSISRSRRPPVPPLYLILYRGAKEHYFPKYREAIEKLIASIELVPKS